jgi:hypothetical protein
VTSTYVVEAGPGEKIALIWCARAVEHDIGIGSCPSVASLCKTSLAPRFRRHQFDFFVREGGWGLDA